VHQRGSFSAPQDISEQRRRADESPDGQAIGIFEDTIDVMDKSKARPAYLHPYETCDAPTESQGHRS